MEGCCREGQDSFRVVAPLKKKKKKMRPGRAADHSPPSSAAVMED